MRDRQCAAVSEGAKANAIGGATNEKIARAATRVATRSRTPLVKAISMGPITHKILRSRYANFNMDQCLLAVPLSPFTGLSAILNGTADHMKEAVMTTRIHIKEAAPKQGCCGGDHAPQTVTEETSGPTGHDKRHSGGKSSAGAGSCCCGESSSDNRSVESQVSPAKPK